MKSYFRFSPVDTYGIICSPSSNVIFDSTGKLAISGSLDRVSLWNLRQSNEVAKFNNEQQYSPYNDIIETTVLHLSKDNTLCAGYSNGMTKLYKVSDQSVIATFHGHKSTIQALNTYHDNNTSLLATGSADCSVIIWDIVARRAVARLRGHQDAVTSVVFLPIRNEEDDTISLYLITASKDTLMKVWDLTTMSCVQTIVGHRSEIWSLRLFTGQPTTSNSSSGSNSNSENTGSLEDFRIFTGSSDEHIRVYSVVNPKSTNTRAEGDTLAMNDGASMEILKFQGSIARSTHDRCLSLELNASKTILSACSAGKTIDVSSTKNKLHLIASNITNSSFYQLCFLVLPNRR